MKTTDKLDNLTKWLGALAPYLTNRNTVPHSIRDIVSECVLDLRAWHKSATKDEDDISDIRKQIIAKDNAIAEAAKKKADEEKKVWGPLKWAELHRRALAVGNVNDSEWLHGFVQSLPCGECKLHFAQNIQQNPPVFRHYFDWTVGIHNIVNVMLGKPVMTVDVALKLYS